MVWFKEKDILGWFWRHWGLPVGQKPHGAHPGWCYGGKGRIKDRDEDKC